ncbi:MAG: hypothetical protein HY541_03530 [Deltaproteobacteria bacterium]|nr:hypothetical protein [Deltaproteobacteria bacterium]
MDFQAFFDEGDRTDTTGEPLLKGYLMSERDTDGTILLKFFDNADFGEGGGRDEAVTLSREGSSVLAHMRASENFFGDSFEHEFQIAANNDYFYRTDGAGHVCLSRTDVDETVHRYNLYATESAASPGSLVTRDSGFSITFTNDDGKKYHGWMGYWGLWIPEEAGLENGDTVNRETFDFGGPSEGTPYTVVIVPGKLKKHTRNTVTLEEIHGVPLHWSHCDFDLGECANFVVEWNKDTQKLMKTARMNQDNWVPEDITPEEVLFTAEDWDFNFWSQSLQGNGSASLRAPETGDLIALTNDSVVIFYKEDIVIPGSDDAPTDLVCFQDCPDPADPSSYLEASRWEAGDDSYQNLAQPVAPGSLVAGTHYAAYTYSADTGLLEGDGNPIVTEASGEFGSGTWTGRMVRPEDLAELVCDWNADNTCAWKVWSEIDVTYSWETGPNEWNRFSALRNPSTGELLALDPPLFLEYVHTNGVKYYLEYNGPGNLYGFPGMCVNMDTGTEVDCGDWSEDTPIRWVTAINAADGSSVTDTATDTQYYTKAMDKEQRMKATNESHCTGAGLAFPDYELPDESLWEEPVIGEEPDVDVPAVIGGVLQ